MKPRPKLAVVDGPVFGLMKALKEEAIVAAVTYRPDAAYTGRPVPDDTDEAFNERFLLITPENVGTLCRQFPDLLSE